MSISERKLESRSKDKVEDAGGRMYKLIPYIINGLPDRIVILPKKPIFFIEFKKQGKKAGKLQAVMHSILRSLGQAVYVVDNIELFMKILHHHKNLPDYDFATTSETDFQ